MNDFSPSPQAARPLPHSYEAEQGLLAAILLENRTYQAVADMLRPHHFAHPAHAAIFETAGKLIDGGHAATPVTLRPYLEKHPALKEVGGLEYLVVLFNSVVTLIGAKDYAKSILDMHQRRRLIAVGQELLDRAYSVDMDSTAGAVQEAIEGQLFELSNEAQGQTTGWVKWQDSLDAALATAEAAHRARAEGRVVGIPTGLADLDNLMGGLHPTDLLILAGRPGMGKTGLAVSIMDGASAAGFKVGMFSLEMSDGQIAMRVLCYYTGLSVERVRTGETSPEDLARMADTRRALSSRGIHIDATPGLTISAIRTRARRLKQRHGLDMVVLDYIGLAEAPEAQARENRTNQVAAITKGCKAMAKELRVPVLALSQLSRGVESRDDKRPTLADLRDSGAVEQDADVVMFVYREQYYLENAVPVQKPDESEGRYTERYQNWQDRLAACSNTADVIVAKNRHGATRTVRCYFDGPSTRFSDLARQGQEP